jgi:hypothetical protein
VPGDPTLTALTIASTGLAVAVLLPRASRVVGRCLVATSLAVCLAAALATGQFTRAPLWLSITERTAITVLLTAGVLAVALVLYLGACQAALAYAEQLRAVFDMHRWRVLEQLRLPLPTNLSEERKAWESLMGFLYRGDLSALSSLTYASPQRADTAQEVSPD